MEINCASSVKKLPREGQNIDFSIRGLLHHAVQYPRLDEKKSTALQ